MKTRVKKRQQEETSPSPSTAPTERRHAKQAEMSLIKAGGPVEKVGPLTPEEQSAKLNCEDQFRKGFVGICLAMFTIKDDRLYREDYKSFEDYAEAVLEVSRVHAHRLAEAGRVLLLLLPMGNILMPACERQVRPLTSVPADLVPTVWKKTIETCNGMHPITAQDVEESCAEFVQRQHNRKPGSEKRPLTYLEQNLLTMIHEVEHFIRNHD